MHRPLCLLLLVSCLSASAQSIGQYEVRQRGSSGFTSYGVSLNDGQVIGQSSGVPAPVTVVPFASPAFTGTPTAPTATGGTNTTQIATTAFVQAALAATGGSITNPTVAYVQTNGDDGTGTVGRPDKPFLTLLAAYSAGANVFIFGAGTFAGMTVSSLDIALIGVGANKTFIGDITGTSGSIYGNGQDMICINGSITIQTANGTNGAVGNPASETPAGDGTPGVDAPSVTVAGLKLADGDIILEAGSGGSGGYGGDSNSNQGSNNGGNGGNGGAAGTLTVRNCNLGGGYWVSIAGTGGDPGPGTNSTDNSNVGGNGGNGGNGGAAGAVIVYNSIGGGFYAAPANAGGAGAGGTGSSAGNPGNAGTAGGAGSITTYFTQCPTTVSNGETTNFIASYINGFWTSLGPNSTGGNGSADAGLLAKYGSSGELKAQSFSADAGTYKTSIDPQNLKFFDTANTLSVTLHDTLAGSFNLYLPNMSADGTLISTNDSGTVTNGMLAGSIAFSKLVGSDITLASTAITFTDITTGNASTTKHGFAPKLDGNSAHYLNGTGGWTTPSSGTVTSVGQSFTGGLVSVSGSPVTSSGTLALTVAGTSGGIPYFSSASTWASSAALAANAIVIGGGAGAAPSTTTTGTGVLTAIGNAVNASGGLLTYGIIGTSGAAVPLLNGTNTWSNAQTMSAGATSGSNTFSITGSNGTFTLSLGGGPIIYFNGGANVDTLGFFRGAQPGNSSNYCGIGYDANSTVGAITNSTTTLTIGLASASPTTKTLSGTQANGSNITAGDLNIGTRGTGTGTGGNINLQSHSAGSTGSTLGTLVTKLSVGPSGTKVGGNGSNITQIKRATATLVAGTVTVSDTDTTANSHIAVTVSSPGGTAGFLSVAVTAGTGYVITSSSIIDTSSLVIKATHFQ